MEQASGNYIQPYICMNSMAAEVEVVVREYGKSDVFEMLSSYTVTTLSVWGSLAGSDQRESCRSRRGSIERSVLESVVVVKDWRT